MAHEAVSGPEMTKIPPQISYTSLLNGDGAHDNTRDATRASSQTHSNFWDLLRQFRLQSAASMLGQFTGARWNADTEYRKVAIHHNRAVASRHGLLHIIPLAGAIILLVFQWTGHWVSASNEYSTTLQFAAKFHELAMQASIIEILLCLVRTGLVDHTVPLGALSGAIQATQLSYLWSLDFFSVWKSRALQGQQKAIFVVAMPALIGLTALVGPSSAVLMIPRSGSPYIISEVTKYSNGSIEALYPSHNLPFKEISLDLPRLNTTLMYAYEHENYLYGNTTIQSKIISNASYTGWKSMYNRVLQYSNRYTDTGIGAGFESNATIPTELTSGKIDLSGLDGLNFTISVVAAHPVVGVQCWFPYHSRSPSSNGSLWMENGTWSDLLPDLRTMARNVSELVQITTNYNVAPLGSSNVWFSPIWIPSPEPGSRSSIAVFLSGLITGLWNETAQVNPGLLQSMLEDPKAVFYAQACKVSAYWNTGEILLTNNEQTILVATEPSSTSKQSDPRPIALNISDAEALHSAVFQQIVMSLCMSYTSCSSAGTLAAVLAVWLSEMPRSRYRDSDRFKEVLYPGIDASNQTAFRFITTKYGFGYGTRSISIYLSMTIMILYCAVTVGYLIFTAITGSASTAWSSGIELVALALQSKKPDHLGHTGVGIDSIKTFNESVGVRVNADNELELVFAHDQGFVTRGLRNLSRNTEY